MEASEREAKIKSLKRRLGEMREYKQILHQEGLEPDEDDKRRESELIVSLLRLEKGLTAKAKPKRRFRRRAGGRSR